MTVGYKLALRDFQAKVPGAEVWETAFACSQWLVLRAFDHFWYPAPVYNISPLLRGLLRIVQWTC